MSQRLILVIGLMLFAFGGQSAAPQGDRGALARDPARPWKKQPPPYYDDERFDRPLKIEGPKANAQWLVPALASQIGASVIIEEPFLLRALPETLNGRPAREAMDALAKKYGAKWEKTGEIYVFVTDPGLAAAMALNSGDRQARVDAAYDRLLQSLTLRQAQTLRKGEMPLDQRNTSRAQQLLLEELLLLAYAAGVEDPTFSLRLAGSGEGAQVELWAADASGKTRKMSSRSLPGAGR
jgi:hypothetical protein